MREIKFRGKSVDDGLWVEGHFFFDYEIGQPVVSEFPTSLASDFDTSLRREKAHTIVDTDTVGQYVSKWSNCYQGDIVDVVCGAGGYPHELTDGRYVVVPNPISGGFLLERMDGRSGVEFNETMTINVVGNIHDNPELLNP